MIINFTEVKVKQAPTGNLNLSIGLTEADPTMNTPTSMKQVDIDTSTFTPTELQCMNDFITLLKSKLP